ncbi:hypothetical protein VNO77_40387 [Canavalia gladiata]|uniref:Uncharacterized protein n=1 Tax=Canavalia gladiata TaxID=3824 RepID=A0AAN9JZW9_CANGL
MCWGNRFRIEIKQQTMHKLLNVRGCGGTAYYFNMLNAFMESIMYDCYCHILCLLMHSFLCIVCDNSLFKLKANLENSMI